MLKVDIFNPPPPLRINEGKPDAFSIHPAKITDADLGALFDALVSRSLEMIARACRPLITGWDDIVGPEGQPIPFNTPDDKQNLQPNTAVILGAAGFANQLRCYAAIMAYAGLPKGDIERVIAECGVAVKVSPT